MYICTYEDMYVCVCVCMSTYVYIYVYVYLCLHIYIYNAVGWVPELACLPCVRTVRPPPHITPHIVDMWHLP